MGSIDYTRLVSEGLAAALRDGDWSAPSMLERARAAIERSPAWLPSLVDRVRAAFDEAPRDRFDDVVAAIARDPAFVEALSKERALSFRRWHTPPVEMRAGRPEWSVPSLPTAGDVASWLGEDVPSLAWLADGRGLGRLDRGPRLAHYVHRWMPKRSGGVRLLEAPKPRLKGIQRRILREILDHVPPHDAAHGFRAGRSVLSHASAHAGRAVVLRMDLEDFFATIPAARVYGIFRVVRYPEEASRVLTGLCTTRASVARAPALPAFATTEDAALLHRARQRYRTRHLPQGAPTSPALANLAAYRMDVRLTAAAREAGATYTRYADDLVFSGDDAFARSVLRFSTWVAAIAQGEGFVVRHPKTRVMRRAVRQEVTGLVVNARPAVARVDVDRLRAILHNCATHGPESQNREGHPDFRAHLAGAVAWVCHVHPERRAKLEGLLARIAWAER